MDNFKKLHAITPKRKQFVIEYEDGSKEIVKEGLLFGFKPIDENKAQMIMKGCGVRSEEKAEEYFKILAGFMMQLCEDEEKYKNFIKSFNG